jgi:hypothetical protein
LLVLSFHHIYPTAYYYRYYVIIINILICALLSNYTTETRSRIGLAKFYDAPTLVALVELMEVNSQLLSEIEATQERLLSSSSPQTIQEGVAGRTSIGGAESPSKPASSWTRGEVRKNTAVDSTAAAVVASSMLTVPSPETNNSNNNNNLQATTRSGSASAAPSPSRSPSTTAFQYQYNPNLRTSVKISRQDMDKLIARFAKLVERNSLRHTRRSLRARTENIQFTAPDGTETAASATTTPPTTTDTEKNSSLKASASDSDSSFLLETADPRRSFIGGDETNDENSSKFGKDIRRKLVCPIEVTQLSEEELIFRKRYYER